MVVKTYRNDGVDHGDGLGARPGDILAGVSWGLHIELDKTLRRTIREVESVGIQVKNSSKCPVSVKIDGSDLSAIYIPKKASESMVVDLVRDIVITNEDGALSCGVNEIVVTVTTGANQVTGAAGLGDIIVTSDFGGGVWVESYTAADDLKHPLNGGTSKKLNDVVIHCLAHPCLIGNVTTQALPLAVGDTFGITKIDIGMLYVINAGIGNDTNLEVVGTEV